MSTNPYAEKFAAAIEWMGPRYIGHPECPSITTAPIRFGSARPRPQPEPDKNSGRNYS